jgi:hypothetical protein
MRNRALFALAVGLLSLANSTSVRAGIITLNSFPAGLAFGPPSAQLTDTDGFLPYSITSNHFHTDNGLLGFDDVINGTTYLSKGDTGPGFGPINLARSDGLPFTLNSFDGAKALRADNPLIGAFPNVTGFDVIGIKPSGPPAFAHFDLPAETFPTFHTLTLDTSFTDVTQVTFNPIGGVSFALDNFNVTAVIPEPGSLALWAVAGVAGLLGWGWLRRKRRFAP